MPPILKSSRLLAPALRLALVVATVLAAVGCDDEKSSGFDAVAIADRVTGNAPLQVNLSARANGPLDTEYTYAWDFGDGESSEEEAPTHIFEQPGTYAVEVVVKAGSSSGSSTVDIEVLPSADLIVGDVAFAPRQVRAGAELDVSFGVRNGGGKVAGGWVLSIVLSEDEVLDENDRVLGTAQRANDEPSESFQGINQLVALPAEIESGDLFVGVVADREGAIGDRDRSNNVAWAPFSVQIRNPMDDGPDLIACGVAIRAFESVPLGQTPIAQLGDQLPVEICLGNNGNRPLASGSYSLYLSKDEVVDDGDRLVGGRDRIALGQGDRETYMDTLDLPLELGAGVYHLIAVADPDDDVEEQLEDNNQRAWPGTFELVEPGPVSGVDLRITAMEVDAERVYWGQQMGGRLTLVNGGDEAVERLFVVRLSVEPTDGGETIQVFSENVQGIGAGATKEIELTIPIGRRVDQGTYRLVALADPTNALLDANPGNNRRTLQTVLTLGGEPDVDPAVAGVSTVPRADAGTEIRVAATVRNLGADDTGPFDVAVILSEDDVIGPDDIVVGTERVANLEGDQPSELSIAAAIPQDLDQQVLAWRIAVVVDPEDRLTNERSEENNVSFAPDPLVVDGASGGCAEDAEFEENDVFGDASAIAAGSYDALGICDDADWYSVTVPPATELDLRLTFAPEDGQPTLRLTDEMGVGFADAEVVARGELRVFALAAEGERTLLFEVTGAGSRLQYGLNVALNLTDPRPDLRVRGVRPSPALTEAGAIVDVDFEVVNAGGGVSPASEAALFVSETDSPDGLTALATVAVPALAPGEVAALRGRITLAEDLADGLYFTLVQADPGALIEERDELDNVGFAQIRVDADRACPADELEPNGSPFEPEGAVQQAVALAAGAQEALVACVGDDDWYAVTLAADERLDVTINFDAEAGDLDLALYAPDGETLLMRSNGLQAQEQVTLLRAVEPGDYLVRVFLNGGGINISTPYQIEVVVQDASACADDGFEPNGDRAAASLLPDGDHDLTLCPGDADWFRFNVPAGNTVRFQLAADDPTVRLALFDPNDVLIDESGRSIAHQADVSGFHRLRVERGPGDEAVSYRLTISGVSGVDLQALSLSLSTVEAAPGDDLRASLVVGNTRDTDADDVTVRFTLSTDEVLSVDDSRLADRLVPRFGGAVETRVNQRISLPADLEDGAWFVIAEIDPDREIADLRPGNNLIATPLAVVPGCIDDDDRSNEGPRSAEPLGDDPRESIVCPFTEDWFVLGFDGAGPASVTLDFNHAAGDLDLQVYAPDGETLLGESRTESDREVVEFETMGAGSVLIRVDGFLDARNTYQLSWVTP